MDASMSANSFNRTFMELKCVGAKRNTEHHQSFNRTFMELKCVGAKRNTEHHQTF